MKTTFLSGNIFLYLAMSPAYPRNGLMMLSWELNNRTQFECVETLGM